MSLKNFKNEVSGTNRIYSREDVGRMSTEEFSANEKAINYQMKNIGVPSDLELKNSSNAVYVEEYTRSDGTVVRGYWRSKPGGGSRTVNNKSPETKCPALKELLGTDFERNAAEDIPEVILKGGVQVIRIVFEKIIQAAQIAIEVIAVALPIVATVYGAYVTGKTIYNKVSDIFSSKKAKVQIKTLNTAIKALRETQDIQSTNINYLANSAARAKNQEEYSKIYEELVKQRNLYQKNEILIGNIENALGKQDYESLMQAFKEYQENMKELVNDRVSSDTKPSINQKIEDALRNAFDQSAYAGEYNVMNQTVNGYNQNLAAGNPSDINNAFPVLKAGISYYVPDVKSLMKLAYKNSAAPIGILYSPLGQIAMDYVNHILNEGAKDAADLMQISIYGPENLEPTRDYMPIDKSFNDKLNKTLGIEGASIEIPKDWYGVVFDENSHLAQSINNSSQYKEILKTYFKMAEETDSFTIGEQKYGFTFDILKHEDANLFKAINNGTIINPQIKDGYFTGILYDKYDFDFLIKEYYNQENIPIIIANNLANILQQNGILNKYYLLVPIRIKL